MPPKQKSIVDFMGGSKKKKAEDDEGDLDVKQNTKKQKLEDDQTPKESVQGEQSEKEENGSPAYLKGLDTSSYSYKLLSSLNDPGWRKHLAAEFEKPYFKKILAFLEEESKKGKEIFPPVSQVFEAFNFTPFEDVKVVLIGQDPYHDNGQAHGLCFSVQPGVNPPPSLKNMYKELETDIPGFKTPKHGYLAKWAKQGILMLNATLTVEAHKANSHSNIGWQTFTDNVINSVLNQKDQPVVFMLWGLFAQKKGKVINKSKHKVVECAHPSPLSAKKWWGCKTFSKVNKLLVDLKQPEIDWTLDLTA